MIPRSKKDCQRLRKIKMKLYIEHEDRTRKISFEGKAAKLLKKLGLNSEVAIIICNGDIVSEDYVLKNCDQVKILAVTSGG